MSRRRVLVLAAAVLAVGLGLGGVAGFLWHAPGRPGTWADVRTWLAFAAVMVGVPAALYQLRLQRLQLGSQQSVIEGEVERNRRRDVLLDGQLRELEQRQALMERQQAEKVDFLHARNDFGATAVVINDSLRPVRNVVCRLEPHHGVAPLLAEIVGPQSHWQLPAPAGRWMLPEEAAVPGSCVQVIRRGWRWEFIFKHAEGEYPGARLVARFTDDAGLYWQVDEDLHLERLRTRDDW